MLVAIDLNSVPSMKYDLREVLPEVPSAQRVEALARGLGANSNAALRASLRAGPCKVQPNDLAFRAYLASRGFEASDRILARTVARQGIRQSMALEDQLTTTGFGVAWGNYKTAEAGRGAFVEKRSNLLTDQCADQFELAMIYLSQLKIRKTLNRDYSTYNLKHQAENISRERGLFTHLGDYVCNGVLIAAAICAGFTVRRIAWDSTNGFVNATTKSIKALQSGQLLDRRTMSLVWRMVSRN
jgi:hypothetical protein